ncbi:MAG: CpsD/CapB family tyrosine-protein kinase [Hyphomonadaceae bacterium]|nr:CpsD/CapB family tyrosine-protein kinase [Clostridia bacterium]
MNYEHSLITDISPKSPISEAYREIRTNIQFASADKKLQVILLTSASPGEGKTTTISNIAIAFAQAGGKVLLVDCDLRTPRLHRVFGLVNTKGMSSVLTQHEDYHQYIHTHKGERHTLDVLICGVIPPNPSELLFTNAMKNFIEQVREEYDYILIDTPPIGTVTDAAILSTLVDGTILVTASGQTEIEVAVRAKEMLDKVKANILGVVLNKMTRATQGRYYYYYYYYYYYGDTDKRSGDKVSTKERSSTRGSSNEKDEAL